MSRRQLYNAMQQRFQLSAFDAPCILNGKTEDAIVDRRCRIIQRQECFQLRRERESVAGLQIERLHAKAIARQQKFPRQRFPCGKGEHAVEPVERRRAPVQQCCGDNFRVTTAAEYEACAFQLDAQFKKIVHLAVVRDDDGASIGGAHCERAVAGVRCVENGKPTMAESDLAVDKTSNAIRAAMCERVGEASQLVRIDGRATECETGYATHGCNVAMKWWSVLSGWPARCQRTALCNECRRHVALHAGAPVLRRHLIEQLGAQDRRLGRRFDTNAHTTTITLHHHDPNSAVDDDRVTGLPAQDQHPCFPIREL